MTLKSGLFLWQQAVKNGESMVALRRVVLLKKTHSLFKPGVLVREHVNENGLFRSQRYT